MFFLQFLKQYLILFTGFVVTSQPGSSHLMIINNRCLSWWIQANSYTSSRGRCIFTVQVHIGGLFRWIFSLHLHGPLSCTSSNCFHKHDHWSFCLRITHLEGESCFMYLHPILVLISGIWQSWHSGSIFWTRHQRKKSGSQAGNTDYGASVWS